MPVFTGLQADLKRRMAGLSRTAIRAGHSRKHVPLQLGYSRRSYSWSNKEFNSSSLNAVIDVAWSPLPKCIDEGLDIQIRIHTQDEMLNSC